MLVADAFIGPGNTFDYGLNTARPAAIYPYTAAVAGTNETPGRTWPNTLHVGEANYLFVDGHAEKFKSQDPEFTASKPVGIGQDLFYDVPNLKNVATSTYGPAQ